MKNSPRITAHRSKDIAVPINTPVSGGTRWDVSNAGPLGGDEMFNMILLRRSLVVATVASTTT